MTAESGCQVTVSPQMQTAIFSSQPAMKTTTEPKSIEPAFWNNTVYWRGRKDGGTADHIKAWSFNANSSGLLSTSPVSQTSQIFSFSAAAPVISANGISNGILWILDNSSFSSSCCQVLY